MDKLFNKKATVENGTANNALVCSGNKLRHGGRLHPSRFLGPRHPTGACLFKVLQLALVILCTVATIYAIAVSIWSANLARCALPFASRTFYWLFFISNIFAIYVIYFIFAATIANPVNLCEYSNNAINMLAIFVIDVLWLTRFTFVYLVHFRPQSDLNTVFVVLFFSPSGVSLIRLLLGSIFVIHFNAHFARTKWKEMAVNRRPQLQHFGQRARRKPLLTAE